MNILTDLKNRGILHSITNETKFAKLKTDNKIYIGFDPTANSLHLGNYVQISQLLRFQQYGYQAVAVLGGATGMIGDPSGKSAERNLLTTIEIKENKKALKKQLEKFSLKVVDNLDFYKKMSFLDFLRQVGKLININYMLSKDVVASRLTTGISFTEFTYQLIQGWDFKCLYENYDVKVQLGGSDQWGNITTGIEIIRKVFGDDHQAVGITSNLLTTASGKKFGKSENNAIWLDKNLSSPYTLYQYLLNIDDQDVAKLLKWLTFLSLNKIEKIIKTHQEKPYLRKAQKVLAFQLVTDIHSEKEANKALEISEALFGKGKISNLNEQDLLQLANAIPTLKTDNKQLIELLVECKAAVSKREAREFLNTNGISLNGVKVNSPQIFLEKKVNLVKKGKKNYFLIIIE